MDYSKLKNEITVYNLIEKESYSLESEDNVYMNEQPEDDEPVQERYYIPYIFHPYAY